MSTKGLTVWLILLTAFVGITEYFHHENLQVRNEGVLIRAQKFENMDANIKRLYANFKTTDARFESLSKYINGPLRNELNEIKKYLHKH